MVQCLKEKYNQYMIFAEMKAVSQWLMLHYINYRKKRRSESKFQKMYKKNK